MNLLLIGMAGRRLIRRSRAGRLGPLVVAVAILVTGEAGPALGSPPLRVVDLGTLGGSCCSQATAINNRGEVVGDSQVGVAGPTHAFLWRDGHMVDLGTLGGNVSTATDINNRGEVVGASALPGGSMHAVLWRDGQPTDLGTLGGDTSFAMAINDAGHVVGNSDTGSGSMHAFYWRDGTMTDLGLLNGGFTHARDINDRDQIIGDNAADGLNGVSALWDRGIVTNLTTRSAWVSAMNNRGQVTGSFFDRTGSFLWERGRTTDLGRLPGATFMHTFGINDRGDVVGYADFDAFLWRQGQLTTLPRLTGRSTAAYDINNRGQIVGFSVADPDPANPYLANHHAVLWTH